VLYWAYGSNLNISRMVERCPSTQIIGIGRVKGWKLVFQENNAGKVVANIEKGLKSDVVEGVIYHIDAADVKSLDSCEGHPTVYKRQPIEVDFEGRGTLRCQTYIMPKYLFVQDGCLPADERSNKYIPSYTKIQLAYGYPDEDYLHHIALGYEEFELNMSYLIKVLERMKKYKKVEKRNDSQPQNVDKNNTEYRHMVFVYGTLMRGERNHGLLAGAEFIGDAIMENAELYDLPYGFPALKQAENNEVVGEVYVVGDELLYALDKLEGYDRRRDEGMYLRRRGKVKLTNGGEVEAFYYLWNRPLPEGSIYVDSGERWTQDIYKTF